MNAITRDPEHGDYLVTLGGVERGRFPTHLQALRALENGTGTALGSPTLYPTRSRTSAGRTGTPVGVSGTGEHVPVRSGRAVMPWTDVAAMKVGKIDPPETPRQAKRWDSAFTRYSRAGLCDRCASQAAWGGQIGYCRVDPPCESCSPIVAEFPGAGHVNGWRSLPEMTRDRRPHRDSVSGSESGGPGVAPTPAPDEYAGAIA